MFSFVCHTGLEPRTNRSATHACSGLALDRLSDPRPARTNVGSTPLKHADRSALPVRWYSVHRNLSARHAHQHGARWRLDRSKCGDSRHCIGRVAVRAALPQHRDVKVAVSAALRFVARLPCASRIALYNRESPFELSSILLPNLAVWNKNNLQIKRTDTDLMSLAVAVWRVESNLGGRAKSTCKDKTHRTPHAHATSARHTSCHIQHESPTLIHVHVTRSPDATHRFVLLVLVGHAESDTKLRPDRPYTS